MRKILGNFSHAEILSFSTVNKTWNLSAKSLLKARGNTRAVIGTIRKERSNPNWRDWIHGVGPLKIRSTPMRTTEAPACKDLVQFSKVIQEMSIVPFSQLKLQVCINHAGPCETIDESTINLITDHMTIRVLELEVRAAKENSEQGGHLECCNAVKVLEMILARSSRQIVELSIWKPCGFVIDETLIPNPGAFPRLKILKYDYFCAGRRPARSELTFLQNIVSQAPNLQELHLQTSTDQFPGRQIRTPKDAAIAEYIIREVLKDSSALLVLSREPTMGLIRPVTLHRVLAVKYVEPYGAETSYQAMASLIRKSRNTLVQAKLDTTQLVQIILDDCPMPKLRRVFLRANFRRLRRSYPALMEAILRKRAWSRCFPALETFEVWYWDTELKPEAMKEFTNELATRQDFAEREQCQADVILPVENLRLFDMILPYFTDREFKFLTELCPGTKRLEVTEQSIHSYIWGQLSTLEHLVMHISGTRCFDSTYCGLHADELAELGNKSTEYLKAVHLVPTQPPIIHLKGNLCILTSFHVNMLRNYNLNTILWHSSKGALLVFFKP